MTCSVNGRVFSKGNLSSMNWTFEQIIERISYGATIFPGDVIGSGTVGTGCLLEINGTEKLKDNKYEEKWLRKGDIVEMEAECLGMISNEIVAEI